MPKLNRREFTKIVGAAGAVAGTSALATPAIAQGKGKVVIIGGEAPAKNKKISTCSINAYKEHMIAVSADFLIFCWCFAR